MKNSHIKKIFLHVGMSKTATSSIQDTLYLNRNQLEKCDYYYCEKLQKNQSDTFRMLCWDKPELQHTSIKLGLDAEKIKLINKQNLDVISQEISETTCSNIIFSGESISAFEPHELQRCKSFLNNLAPEATIYIVISTRNPIDYINSLVQQRKRTSSRGRNKSFYFLYESIFEKLLNVFGKKHIIAYSFENACRHLLGPVGHFLNAIGIEDELMSNISVVNSNSSISDKAIDIIDFINHEIPMLEGNKISDGRIHLDYAHFFTLSGKKFQVAKNSNDINISVENLTRSCQWLSDNIGIEYKLKELPESAPRIVYDDTFNAEIKTIFPFLSPVLKKLTYQYINNKRKANYTDPLSKQTLTYLAKWIQSNHQSTLKNNLSDTINLQSKIITDDKEQRQQLIQNIKGESVIANDFFYSIVIFLTHYEFHDEATFFNDKASANSSGLKRKSIGQISILNQTKNNDLKNLSQLMKRFNRSDIRAGNFFRDLAAFLEHYNMFEASLFFIVKAKMYSPNLKSIDEKLKKYEEKLRIQQASFKYEIIVNMKSILKNIKKVLFNKYIKNIISEKAVYEKALENEQLLTKILCSDEAVENILSGNKTLERILSGDRAVQKILGNQEIRNKILCSENVEVSSTNNSLNKTRLVAQNKTQDVIKKLDYSLPSYLIGFPRSGTNFLQSVLEGSSGLLCRSLYGVPRASQSEILSLKSHTTSYELLLDEIDRFAPSFGIPNKFILIVRDPRDVFISFYEFVQSQKNLSISQNDFIHGVSYFFATFENRHKVNSRKLEIAPLSIFDAYKKHISNWVVNRPQTMDCHVVKYEELISSPESEFQRIFDFLNIECNLEKDKLKLKVSQYSKTTRPRGVIAGWKECQNEYKDLIASVNKAFKEEISILGYYEE